MNLNADLGESWYTRRVGDDAALMPYLDSCNLACGFHGGDAYTMLKTIELAQEHGVAIGAHPSFADRRNFGRERLVIDNEVLYAQLLYQVAALKGMVESYGAALHHLKPHGALYHYANEHPAAAQNVAMVAATLDVPLVYGPPEGYLRDFTEAEGLTFWAEGFADRAYTDDGTLLPRSREGAVLSDDVAVRRQVEGLLAGEATSRDGKGYAHRVATICVHGDHPGAAERAKLVRETIDGWTGRVPRRLQ